MKKTVTVFTLTLGLLFSVSAFGQDEIKLNIDGKSIECDVPPQIVEGRTMVPIRAIFESVGANVNWDNDTKTVTGTKGKTDVKMTLNSKTALVNGTSMEMDCSPIIIEGRSFAPARYVAEAFGCDVEWNGESKTVNIKTTADVQITKEETTIQSTKETVTETTTLEATTNPMYSYNTYYEEGTYIADKNMPAGEYVVFANPGEEGYLYKYANNGIVSTNIKNYFYAKSFDYNDIVTLDEGQCIDISKAYAVPIADAKLEPGHSGTYKGGLGIKEGHLTFKLSPKSKIGFIDFNDSEKIIYLHSENDTVVLNITDDTYVIMYGCDVLDENLSPIFTYEPYAENNNGTDSNLNFSDVTPSVKKAVDDYLTALVKDMTPAAMKSTKYANSYYDMIAADWEYMAKNDADKKYVELGKAMYNEINKYAFSTNGDIALAKTIRLYSRYLTDEPYKNMVTPPNRTVTPRVERYISGDDYRDILRAEKDMYTDFVKEFKNASSFGAVEAVCKNAAAYRLNTIRLDGNKIE